MHLLSSLQTSLHELKHCWSAHHVCRSAPQSTALSCLSWRSAQPSTRASFTAGDSPPLAQRPRRAVLSAEGAYQAIGPLGRPDVVQWGRVWQRVGVGGLRREGGLAVRVRLGFLGGGPCALGPWSRRCCSVHLLQLQDSICHGTILRQSRHFFGAAAMSNKSQFVIAQSRDRADIILGPQLYQKRPNLSWHNFETEQTFFWCRRNIKQELCSCRQEMGREP